MVFNCVICVVADFPNIDCFVWTVNVNLGRIENWVNKAVFLSENILGIYCNVIAKSNHVITHVTIE